MRKYSYIWDKIKQKKKVYRPRLPLYRRPPQEPPPLPDEEIDGGKKEEDDSAGYGDIDFNIDKGSYIAILNYTFL